MCEADDDDVLYATKLVRLASKATQSSDKEV